MADKTYKFLSKDNWLYIYQKLKLKFNAIDTAIDGKVDKVDGKGLSTNDLTDALVEKINNAGDSSFTGNYADLNGKPKINNVELGAENTLSALGIQPAGDYLTSTDIANMATQSDIADFVTDADVEAKGYLTQTDVDALDYATEAYVDTAVSGLVNSAPEALDTLKELSDALGNDANFATTMTTELGKKLNTADLTDLTNAEIDEIMV